MNNRTFRHQFTDQAGHTTDDPALGINVAEVALAAMREIVQLSLNATPFNLFLDGLLTPGTPRFEWVSGLGHVRETRTALSGLFGRFVARAYLARHHAFRYFEPIYSDTQSLSGWPSFHIRRKRGRSGDLPDWIIAGSAGPAAIAIAEAKGSHDIHGPFASLDRARTQVDRIEVVSGNKVLGVKRFAIATRWAIRGNPNLSEPWLVVRDPDDGEPPNSEEANNFARSTALGHFASLASGFGLPLTAAALQQSKMREPGHLAVPENERLRIATDSGETEMICAVATSAGVIPIPRGIESMDFITAVRTVYGEHSLLLGVDVSTLSRIDEGALGVEEIVTPETAVPTVTTVEELFAVRSRSTDGTETIPLQQITRARP